MIIIEKLKPFKLFLERYIKEDAFMIPIYSDNNKHTVNNKLCLLYVYFLETKDEYMICLNHSESMNINTKLYGFLNQTNTPKFILDKKGFLNFFRKNDNFFDADLVQYFQKNTALNISDISTGAHNYFTARINTNVNEIIPIGKHYEKCKKIKDKFIESFDTFKMDNSFTYYDKLFIDNLKEIESNGLYVDPIQFKQAFGRNGIQDNLVYSEYNIYTSAGRPSNSRSGINFNALNKETGQRLPFVSRFGKNGFLIQFDYDAYHLRLIADLIGYDFPKDQKGHEYMAQYYFNKNDISVEEYEKSKAISFRQLYGGIQQEYLNIPFFQQVQAFIDQLWIQFNTNGYAETPVFKRKMYKHFFEDMNRHKLFNYILQSLESEKNMVILGDILKCNTGYKSKLILYTYDSFLIDFNSNDGKEFILKVKNILRQEGKYPVKLQIGADYHNMQTISSEVMDNK